MSANDAERTRIEHAAPQARVFVGLRIAPEIASKFAELAAGLEKLSVRPVAPADIHLTLVPPWNETSIPDAVAKLGRLAGSFDAFWLIFRHVGYRPEPRRPRLLWVDCAVNDEIAAVRAALLEAFEQFDERPFQPHVTLARIRSNCFVIAGKYPIDQQLSLTQHVESIELFQSPPPGGRGYRVLASMGLGEAPGSTEMPQTLDAHATRYSHDLIWISPADRLS